MKSEEIIENLLRKKYISPKEALILLKDIAKTDMSKTERYHSTYIDTTSGDNWINTLFNSNSSGAKYNIDNGTSSIKSDITYYDTNP